MVIIRDYGTDSVANARAHSNSTADRKLIGLKSFLDIINS